MNPTNQPEPVDLETLKRLMEAAKRAKWSEVVYATTRLNHALRNAAPALIEELERLRATVEGSKMAFESVVEDKRELSEQCGNLQLSLSETLKIIERNNCERDSLRRENEELRGHLSGRTTKP